jgi:DNA-binding NarL/FixJ family response regulator
VKTRVLLLDDHTIFRQGVARLLNAEPDLELKAHCGSIGEALLVLAVGVIDFVLLDVDLGNESGIDFLRQARANGYQGPVLILTAGLTKDQKEVLEQFGISGVLEKDAPVEVLAARIREITGMPKPAAAAPPRTQDALRRFSAREVSVLRLVVEGCTNKEIATELQSTEPAIKSILQQLFRKTGTRTRSQLVRVALEQHRDLL